MSSPPASEVSIRVRKRGDTLPGCQEIPPPSQPLQNAAGYTHDRIQLGLHYADAVIRVNGRNLSPIGRRTLSIYRDACLQLLSLDEKDYSDVERLEEVRRELLGTVRMFEESRAYKACLAITKTKDAEELSNELLRLLQTAFYARYGDIFGEACRILRHEAEAGKVIGWSGLNKRYWTSISKTLIEEKPWYERLHKGEDVYDQCPTHLTVIETCHRLGFKTDDMLAAIYHYAQRNELLHTNLLPMIRDGNYADLAMTLKNDYVQVPCIVQDGEVIQEKVLLNVIEAMIDLWFVRDDPDYPENPQAWVATNALKMRARELRGPNPQDEGKVNKAINEEINKALARRMRAERRSREISGIFESDLIISDPKKRVKRVASADLEGELKRAKRQKREWDKLQRITSNVYTMKEAYEDMWGEFLPPANPIHDPSLDGLDPEPEDEPADEPAEDAETMAYRFLAVLHRLFAEEYRQLEDDQPELD
ncbi:hypothetical protein V494_07452 [Pseudogymnoascus sp. VKM F-4513 (FW-928)]|nr:hypothetical protein V494_07452 [Pseudogymnoascus sp. VKM F-4513 (FW-928)]